MIEQFAGGINNPIFNIDIDIKINEFIKFYFKMVNRTLNHLGKHSENTQIIAGNIAETLDLNSSDKKLLKYGSLLHDIGKLFIPAELLNSSRVLTPVELEMIKAHTKFGYEALDNFITLPDEIKVLAISHHYRHGFGYPEHPAFKIDSFKIDPLLIDILTVADSFSAIMEPRAYKKPVSEIEALKIISDPDNEKNKGLNLDVIDKLKYLIDNQKISLKEFF